MSRKQNESGNKLAPMKAFIIIGCPGETSSAQKVAG